MAYSLLYGLAGLPLISFTIDGDWRVEGVVFLQQAFTALCSTVYSVMGLSIEAILSQTKILSVIELWNAVEWIFSIC